MKKVLIVLALVLAVAFCGTVSAKEKMASLGMSFNLPYVVSPSDVKGRGPFGMDLIGEYYINPNFALNLMFQFQFEQLKSMYIDPGVRYYFFTDKTWSPYVNLQAVLGLKDGSVDSNFNYGFRVGPGINFDLSELTGLEGLNTFFDVDFWGVFKTARVWSMDVFRLGFAYAF